MTIALSISHALWIAARVESMGRLREQLGVVDLAHHFDGAPHFYREETERTPLHYWSESQWRWALATGADVCLFAQDDIEVAPDFWARFEALCSAPWTILAMHSAHPAGMTIARAGGRWYTTADGLIGTMYAMRRDELERFLAWRRDELLPGGIEAITEDTMIGCYALARGIRIWSPLPALHDHLTHVASEFANDQNPHRRPLVTWKDADVLGPEVKGEPPHLGRFWRMTSWTLKRWCPAWSPELHEKAEADLCPERFRRFFPY